MTDLAVPEVVMAGPSAEAVAALADARERRAGCAAFEKMAHLLTARLTGLHPEAAAPLLAAALTAAIRHSR